MGSKNLKQDPYLLHRTALRPLLPDATQEELAQSCQQIPVIGETDFLAFLHQQGLAPMWDKALIESGAANQLSASFKASLHQARLHSTGNYLIQKNSLKLIRDILDDADIPHAVYKGADIRERYYSEPSLRPAVDIDILVQGHRKIDAINAFKRQGFEFYAVAENISHEANLIKGGTSIDLHWDILRPGRTRTPMIDTLLSTKQDYGSHWGLSEEASLFILLVHPVFAKYSTTPQASLMRTVDLAQVIARKGFSLEDVIQLVDKAGLKTAAWISLKWLMVLTGSTTGNEAIERLKPGRLREKYLNWWLERNLASRLLEKPVYVQLGLTLPAHDKMADAIRAVKEQRRAARNAERELHRIEEMIS